MNYAAMQYKNNGQTLYTKPETLIKIVKQLVTIFSRILMDQKQADTHTPTHISSFLIGDINTLTASRKKKKTSGQRKQKLNLKYAPKIGGAYNADLSTSTRRSTHTNIHGNINTLY